MLPKTHKKKYHNYADDLQVYISLSPDDLNPSHALTQSINDINLWMSNNFLQLNKDRQKYSSGAKAQRQKIAAHLSFPSLQSKITRSDFYHLKQMSKLRGSVKSRLKNVSMH